jgi:predicted enzyme related to lactoylglutathione lyase
MQQNSALTWFEIPAGNLNRASSFYETILNQKLKREVMGPQELAVFEYEQWSGTGGCLIKNDVLTPTDRGSVVYLNAGKDLDAVLTRVEHAGGRIALGKTALPGDMGYYAHIIDSEGNRVGLHAYG